MLTKSYGFPPQSPLSAPTNEIIVKFRTDHPAKERLSTIGRMNDIRSPMSVLMDNQRILQVLPLLSRNTERRFSTIRLAGATADNTVAMENADNPALSGLNRMILASPQEAAAAITALSGDPLIEYAHVPAIRTFAATDPHMNRQWGLRAINYFSAIAEPGYNSGQHIKVAILDSGIDPAHRDLSGVFADNVNFSTLGADDDTGHGTHVAGIIAAITNNGIGISGTCGSTQLMILRGLTSPYQFQAYYNAIDYATTQGAQVLNCSLGGPHDPTEALLIQIAIERGVIVVAAMGNDYQRGNPISYPAALPNVIAVGACSEMDNRAPFSQTGTHIDLVAPGTNILSTTPTYPVSLARSLEYDSWDGTSMATPFVTAAVALLLAKRPGIGLADVVRSLHQSADKINGQTDFTEELGYGRLNLPEALRII